MTRKLVSLVSRGAAPGLSLLLVALALPAAAIEILPNGDMPSSLDTWTLSPGGVWSHAPGQGIFGAMGAAEVSSNGSGELSMTYCADVSDRVSPGSVTASGYQRPVNHTSPVSVSLTLYAGAGCSGAQIGAANNERLSPTMDVWSFGSLVLEIPMGGASSALFAMKVSGTASGQTTRFAHGFLTESVVRDGHFTTNPVTDHWAINNGDWIQTSADGHSTPNGVAQGTVQSNWALMSTCQSLVNASPYAPTFESILYVTDAAFKPLDVSEQQRILLEWYENASCTGLLDSNTFFSAPSPPVGVWSTFGGFRFKPRTAQSYVLRFGTNSNDQFPATQGSRVLWDNVRLTPTVWIFRDGFESGDTTTWSSTLGD